MTLETILIATDFSEAGQGAVVRGFDLARQFRAAVHLLHVIPRPPVTSMFPISGSAIPETPATATEWTQVQEDVGGELARIAHEVAPDIECTTSAEVAYGPASYIVEWAESNDASIIVMGTHGHQGARHLLLGSVAESVVRSAPCAVLTVGANVSSEPHRPKKILGALDLEEGTDGVVAAVEELCRAYGAQAHYLHVVPPVELGMYLDDSSLASFDPATLIENATPQLRARLDALDIETSECVEGVTTGRPDAEIVRYGEDHEIDLIVVARHSRPGLPHVLMGSVADRVIRTARCPVLTVLGKDDGDDNGTSAV